MIVVEDLKITNMSKSAKGTIDRPGSRVKAKSGLNKSILDQGWGEFKRQLSYKLEWLGGIFLKVCPQYTSQRCSACGFTEKENRLSQSIFSCISYSYTENAETNAAKNILAAGHAVFIAIELRKSGSVAKIFLNTLYGIFNKKKHTIFCISKYFCNGAVIGCLHEPERH
jgi:putative transposase